MNRALTPFHIAFLGFVGTLLALPALGQLRCDNTDSSVVRLACRDTDVRRLIRQIDAVSKRRGCTAEQADELAVVRRAWGRRQFACYVKPDAKACVIPELRAEIDYFKPFDPCEVAAHPMKFDPIEPSYVLAHPAIYVGTEIRVVGTMVLESCEPASTSVAGAVLEYPSERQSLSVEFKSMPARERSFLCEKRPLSSWRGTVRMRPVDRPYLQATDILGTALP